LTLDCDRVLCSTWRVKSTSAARSEIDAQEKFISFFKVGVLTRVMSGAIRRRWKAEPEQETPDSGSLWRERMQSDKYSDGDNHNPQTI
jgi:hypothetical protein